MRAAGLHGAEVRSRAAEAEADVRAVVHRVAARHQRGAVRERGAGLHRVRVVAGCAPGAQGLPVQLAAGANIEPWKKLAPFRYRL